MKSLPVTRHAVSLLLALVALAPATAFAHHPMGGAMVSTFGEGLLSGLGHPLIGPDHLAFILAVGLLAVPFARGYLLALAFVVGGLVGCAIHLGEAALPLAEIVIAGSGFLAGLALLLRLKASQLVLGAAVAFAGIFHGYAYGESVVGAEPTPLVAYLIGFTAIQFGVAAGAWFLARRLVQGPAAGAATAMRMAGALIAVVGGVFLVQAAGIA